MRLQRNVITFYDLTENLIEDILLKQQMVMGNESYVSRVPIQASFSVLFRCTKDSQCTYCPKNPVEALLDSSQDNSFVNRWGGELKRDNFDVKMLQIADGSWVVIRHKKDLLGYEGNVDWKSPITRICHKV